MDFDKPKVYGDTFISDGLVLPGHVYASVTDCDHFKLKGWDEMF